MEKKTQTNNIEISELQCIKNLLILQLIRDGATSEEISMALKTGQVSPSNIRASFPMKKIRRKNG